jgi:hypothetical protein
MNDLFTCPKPTALAAAPDPSCPIRWDQIQKMGIRRITGRTTLTTATILLAANITPLLSAADNTKLLISPFLADFKIPQSEPIKQGGNDNTTLNGMPKLEGFGFVTVTFEIRNVDPTTADALRALASESGGIMPGATDLEGWFFNRYNKIIIDNPASTQAIGFKLYNFVVSDVGTEGLNKDNIWKGSFDLEPLWSKTAKLLTPTDWVPLTVANS